MNCLLLHDIDITQLHTETLVLTSNQRLALRLSERYDQYHKSQGKHSWKSPQIMALNSWLTQTWQQYNHTHLLLSDPQALHALGRIISESHEGYDLLNPEQTAHTALRAWHTLHRWDQPLSVIANHPTPEVSLFYQWAHAFQLRCQEKQWITSSEIPAHLANQDTLWSSYTDSILLGFDEVTPVIARLFNIALTDETDLTLDTTTSVQVRIHDTPTEIETMASFAFEKHRANPNARIGCIVPELEQLKRTLVNTFTATFEPNSILPGERITKKRFNISAGESLYAYPIIHTAINLLACQNGSLDVTQTSALLQSPYLHCNPDEQDHAAHIDNELRARGELCLPFQAIFSLPQQAPDEITDKPHKTLIQRLYDFHHYNQALPSYATLAYWRNVFITALEHLGWPGYRTLNSEEYQLHQRFLVLLDELLQFTPVCTPKVSWQEAHRLLKKIARSTIFQSEGSRAPVQIMGTLEAAGTQFDHLWVMGLDDETWPPAPKPNPFLPYELQKALNMPHATPARELHYTQKTMSRLASSAPHVIFSSAEHAGDKILNASQLLRDIPLIPTPYSPQQTSIHSALIAHTDEHAPPLHKDEAVQGGAWLLKEQAECPFKAFGMRRLHAQVPHTLQFGLRPENRGTLIHDILERLWRDLKDSKTLHALDEGALETKIEAHIDAGLAECHTNQALTRVFLQLEKKRLKKLIYNWLSYEKKRADFTVTGIEVCQKITLSTLTFTLRIDRIDTLSSGEKVVIDYKTGSNTIANWFGPRLKDPQLPLYLCLYEDIKALTFAEIKTEGCTFKGLTETEALTQALPNIKTLSAYTKTTQDWSSQRDHWQKTIINLAQEFESGLASVAPTSPASCTYCDLKPLCRVEMI